MSKISRKHVSTDCGGNVFSFRVEELNDDEHGTIEENHTAIVCRCEACDRPIENTSEIHGRCVVCGNSCCSFCIGYCSICKRGPICGSCRQGFPEKGLSVCSSCLPALAARLAYEDQLIREKASFERALAVYDSQIKLAQLLQQSKTKIPRLIARVMQFRVARKIARLERQLRQGDNRGQRLLP
jgi:hypothetical protein